MRSAGRVFALAAFCGQSPDPLGDFGMPASGSRSTDSDGVGLPTGSGSVDRHAPTRYTDSRVSVYRLIPTRSTDIAEGVG